MNDRDMGMGGPGGYRHNNNQRNNQNHYNNHSNYNNHNRYNKHNNNQYNNSPHPHNYNNNNSNIKQLPPRFSQMQDLSGKNIKNFSSQNSPVAKQNNMHPNQMQSQHHQPSHHQNHQNQQQQQIQQQQTPPPPPPQQSSTETFDTFRPPINSLLYKATNPSRQSAQLPISQQPRPASASSIEADSLSMPHRNLANNVHTEPLAPVPLVPPPKPANNILNKDQVIIKSASQEKPKQNKKDKGPNKEEYVRRVLTFVKEWLVSPSADNENATNMDDVAAAFFEIKVPDKYMRDAVTAILNEIIDKNDGIYDRVIEFLSIIKKEGKLQQNALLDSFKTLINGMNDSPVPRITTLVATLLSRSVAVKLCKLSDVANYTENGAHYPLFLLVLQQLYRNLGKPLLLEIFNESKVNLMSSLPEADRTKDRMAEILEDRNLSFLYPLLKLQGELQKQIQTDPNPQTLYKWIKDNVEPVCFTDPGFVTAIMNVTLKYVTQVSVIAQWPSALY